MKSLHLFFIKKVIIYSLKKLFSARKFGVSQNNIYGNADRECLTDYLCLRLFEENDHDEIVFDDLCRQCLCYTLKAGSYLLYNLFLEEKCN